MKRYAVVEPPSSSPIDVQTSPIDPQTTNETEKTILGDNAKRKHLKVDLNSLPADPGECPSKESYHVNQRDEIRKAYLQKGPCQPQKHSYPQREFGAEVKNREFCSLWFDDHKYWLEYSVKRDAAFCLCCYLFKFEIKNQGGSHHFVKTRFIAWNRISSLGLHSIGTPHKTAVQKWQNLMNQKQAITTGFDKHTTTKKEAYYIRLNASIDVVRFLLQQGLPFRGHGETKDSLNKGNFLELLEWLADQCDVVTRAALKSAPINCQLKCGSIQKQIVRSCAKVTIEFIMEELGDEFFSILVDESRDVSCKEQMALVLRFVNTKGVVVERFIGIRPVDNTSALSLKELIYAIMSDLKLSPTRMRGQGYDGASNMNGAFNGLKTFVEPVY